MTQLVTLQKRPDGGFLAIMYESHWGGYAYRVLMMSKTAAIRELRSRGVICPRYAFQGVEK